MIEDSTLLVTLTVGQIRELIDERVAQALATKKDDTGLGEPVWGIKELSKFLGLSKDYTSVIVSSGKYSGAIIKAGRKVGFYPKLLNEMLAKSTY